MLCGTCGGSGIYTCRTCESKGYEDCRLLADCDFEPCPSCAGSGVVIPDRIIEAAAEALDPFMVHPLETEAAARAALVAAAKEQAKVGGDS
jgi:hypothetical protein